MHQKLVDVDMRALESVGELIVHRQVESTSGDFLSGRVASLNKTFLLTMTHIPAL